MSTFSGFIPELPGIAIDCFEAVHRSKAVTFFLSHCHADHMRGLEIDEPLPGELHLSPISAVFIRHRFSRYADVVRPFNVGEHLALKIEPPSGEKAYELYVHSISAEHCPGSVMFYFETESTRVLYTGDFRLSSQKRFATQFVTVQPKIIYLDSTFLDLEYSHFPCRDESTRQIVTLCREWLADDRRNVIALWLPATYGSEELFLSLFDQLKEKIHISDKQRGPYMHFASLDKVLTGDTSARIHACTGTVRPNGTLSCRTPSDADKDYHIRTIRPSALRWRGLQPSEPFWKESSDSVLFYVCYSAHASCNEIGDFVRHFRPHPQDVRFNVIADETDQIQKKNAVASMLKVEECLGTNSTSKSELENDECWHLDRIQYKQVKLVKQASSSILCGESSESDGNEDQFAYVRLPKRTRTD